MSKIDYSQVGPNTFTCFAFYDISHNNPLVNDPSRSIFKNIKRWTIHVQVSLIFLH